MEHRAICEEYLSTRLEYSAILQIVFHLKSRMALIKERFQNSASDSEYKYKQYQDIILYSRITLVL